MSDYITTYSGTHFFPTEPDMKDFHIRDVAHALSFICRGNGHVKLFFSVGQHCINCSLEAEARGYSERVVLACLLHDASEAYMSDVPRPFKKYLKDYKKLEDRLLSLVYEKYLGSDITEAEARLVKQIDFFRGIVHTDRSPYHTRYPIMLHDRFGTELSRTNSDPHFI